MNGVYVFPGSFVPDSIRLPKFFQPVGVTKQGMLYFLATRSTAPVVGKERAQPFTPPRKNGMHCAC